jgi:hypothetical protein
MSAVAKEEAWRSKVGREGLHVIERAAPKPKSSFFARLWRLVADRLRRRRYARARSKLRLVTLDEERARRPKDPAGRDAVVKKRPSSKSG